MKIWTIYCHTHVESGRRYIGLTSQTMEKRWKNHINASKNSKGGYWHFANSIRKYGKDAFTHEVLAQSWDLESANATEEQLIEQEGTRDPLKGFNLAKGGTHVPHPIRKNPWDNSEYRAKQLPRLRTLFQNPAVRAANKAALNTPESRAKRSQISRENWANQEEKFSISAKIKEIANSPKGKKDRSLSAGLPHSSERIRKNSEAQRKKHGIFPNLETREKIAAASKANFRPKSLKNLWVNWSRREFCRKGHSMEDSYIRSDGSRICRTCAKIANAKRYA